MGAGLFGSAVPGSSTSYLAATFMAMAAYGVTLAFLHHMALTREDGSSSLDRRAFLQRAAFFGVLVVVGGFSLRAIIRGASSISTARAFRTSGKMPPEVTPNEEFYVVASGIVTPNVKVASWELYVGGGLEGPLTLSYEELQAMPWIEEYVTLTCISNVIGGDLISNALWRGVPLKALMERARLPDSTERIAFHAVDGYVDSFPMDYAMRDHTMVAYMMNGEPLSDSHGFPARIIVPGLYGMENVKWLTRIEPVPADFRGYWQVRGWADTAVIRTMSRIDIPEVRLGATLGENEVGGVAFAGDRGIDKVEISTDDQESWQSADLSRPLSPYTWVLWKTLWVPPGAGRFGIAVRATDGDGVVQTSLSQASLPSGAAGHHKIFLRASGDRPVAIASPTEEPKAPGLPFLR
jgi:DMSO/TMAO reductase YedYZ molybdopterin-dependent catalytic subunit